MRMISLTNFGLLRRCVYVSAHNILSYRWVKIMRMKEAIVLRFRLLCKERKIKYNKLATMSGVTPSTVYSMMDPRRKDISAITVKKLCDGLGISIPEFYGHPIFQNLEQEIQ